MVIIDDERVKELAAMTPDEKTALAKQHFDSILEKKDEKTADEVCQNIHIFATNILFEDYAFSATEEAFLKEAIGLDKEKAYEMRYDCDEYLYTAIDVFRTKLDDEDKLKLSEIMLMLAAVDEHSTKKELRLVRKLLSMI